MSNGYRIELSDGSVHKVRDASLANHYDRVDLFGLSGIVNRWLHQPKFKAIRRDTGASLQAIILPNGERVTQF